MLTRARSQTRRQSPPIVRTCPCSHQAVSFAVLSQARGLRLRGSRGSRCRARNSCQQMTGAASERAATTIDRLGAQRDANDATQRKDRPFVLGEAEPHDCDRKSQEGRGLRLQPLGHAVERAESNRRQECDRKVRVARVSHLENSGCGNPHRRRNQLERARESAAVVPTRSDETDEKQRAPCAGDVIGRSTEADAERQQVSPERRVVRMVPYVRKPGGPARETASRQRKRLRLQSPEVRTWSARLRGQIAGRYGPKVAITARRSQPLHLVAAGFAEGWRSQREQENDRGSDKNHRHRRGDPRRG